MLRSNSKKAIENLKNYIVNHFDFTGYEETGREEPKTQKDIFDFVYKCFLTEKYSSPYERKQREQDAFIDWASGLPGVLDTCYYYNRSAVNDLGEILEETNEEQKNFTERQAEKYLTSLIYITIKRELKRG